MITEYNADAVAEMSLHQSLGESGRVSAGQGAEGPVMAWRGRQRLFGAETRHLRVPFFLGGEG